MRRPAVIALLAAVMLAALLESQAAVPDAARKQAPPTDGSASTTVGAKKFAATNDCAGAVAFSGVGLRAAPKSGSALTFRGGLTDKGIGWSAESGEFTCYCPGLYQLAFSGDAAAQLALKKKTSSSAWTTVVVGSSHVVLLDMEVGDKAAVFLDGGSQSQDSTSKPTTSFSGFRVAKKQ